MIITEHAARRYIRRLAPTLSLAQARTVLRRASKHARLLPQRTDAGQQLWQTADCGGAVLVVKHDPEAGPVVVTVLSEGQTREADDEEVDEVREAFERQELAREEQRRICEAERDAAMGVTAPRGTPSPPPPPAVGKNKARRLAHEARQAAEHAQALARRAERQRAHQERCALDQAEKAARERAQAREHSVVCFAQWAGVLP